MAEAVAKYLSPPKVRIFSAGIKPTPIPSEAHKVMAELGIPLSGQSSKEMKEVPLSEIDLLVSFGNAAKKSGPIPSTIKVEDWPVGKFDLPASKDAASLAHFRQERDEIRNRVFALFMDYWRNVT